ncbi:MAG: protein-disulfide isomerase [Porticoccaceae bacterium]|nr:MAG: protein-disulfide isomerase [Porticoccaceae bacterium]
MIKNIMGFMVVALLVSSSLLSMTVIPSANAEQVSADLAKTITGKLKASRPDLSFGAVETTPVSGLYLVRINGTQFFYVNETGEYIISGDMYRARPGLFVPVKDLAAANIRKNRMAGVPKEDTIIFPAVGKTKAIVYVFTDVDCHYCRKLHNESVPVLNQQGVEVRYLAYPRAGLNSASYRKIASAWCAEDKQKALSALKNRQSIPENICDNNPVAAQYALGQEMGVTGTPALIMEDGTMLPGYRPAPELLKIIGVK